MLFHMPSVSAKRRVKKIAEPNVQLEALRLKLKGAGIPLSGHIHPEVIVNTRAKRRLGCCIYREGMFYIEIAQRLLAEDQRELLEETLVHELLHTCYGCQNHGKRWKYYAEKVSGLFGYHVTRTAFTEDSNDRLRQDSAKYLLVCNSCGAEIIRMRLSKAVKQPHKFRCKCGGTLRSFQIVNTNAG